MRALSGHDFKVDARDKALYHAAAVFVAGHAVALFDLATELLARCGLTQSDARRILLPLARGTVANLVDARSTASALTGPFARADASTVRRHLDALAARPELADALAIYLQLGRRSLQLAGEAGADGEGLREIAEALAERAKSRW